MTAGDSEARATLRLSPLDESSLTFQRLEPRDFRTFEGLEGGMNRVLQVEKMNCQGCARKIAAAVETVAPGANVQVDLERKMVEVATDSAEEAGFPAKAIA